MNAVSIRNALILGLIMGALNVAFSGFNYGFDALPAWFYLAQLLLLPAMLLPLRYFPQATQTRDFVPRAALYAMGWGVPYAVYTFSHDALSPAFDPVATLGAYLIAVAVFSLLFAAIRRPGR